MKLKLMGDGSAAGTLIVCEKTGCAMAGAELKWIRVNAANLEVEISVARFFAEISTHGTIPTLLVKQPPIIRPYFVAKVVGDGTYDFTKVVAHDTDDEMESIIEAYFRVEEGQKKPSLILVVRNPACQFGPAVTFPSTVTGAINAGSVATGGTRASFFPPGQNLTAGTTTTTSAPSVTSGGFGPGHVFVPGSFPNGAPGNPDPDDTSDPARDGCQHEYETVHLFTSKIQVCKHCKKEKK